MSSISSLLGTVTQSVAGGGEERTGQLQMAELVDSAISEKDSAIAVQAGTGTGKGIAYLTPIVHALGEGRIERAIIATATIALQDQLLGSDVPTTVEALGADVSASVLKGRSNYLCLQRLDELNEASIGEQQQLLAGTDAQSHLPSIAAWLETTSTGDREELVPAPPGPVWRAVSVGPDECPGAARCPRGSECYAERARSEAAEADIVITNHHFYGLHMASEGALLPDHDLVVFDEAHHLPDVISATSGAEITGGRFRNIARRTRGLLADSDVPDLLIRSADDVADELAPRTGSRLTISADLMAVLLAGRTRADSAIRELRKAVGSAEDSSGSLDTKTATRVERAMRMLTSLIDDIDIVINAEPDKTVLWVDGSPSNPILKATPIDVTPLCEEWLWPGHSVVLTSATLASTIGTSLGLPELEVVSVPSPFDYAELGLLYCPLHLPAPNDHAFPEQCRQEIQKLVEAAGGRSLCLFTSYRAMEGAAEFLDDQLSDAMTVLVQGTESKAELIRRFVDTERAVLLATMSFWQGVDLPGDDLTLVTIDRLPFPRPDDPVLSARREREGSAAFRTIDLPRAATLLAQAAGRLVRRADDRGVVAVLDKRLGTSRNYRWELINALPPFRRTKDPQEVYDFLRSLDLS
ncbi:MAG: ATP-dependent DNA helicase [Acidimicrobiales bacterium]|nr:ATP-dependent DNA helicase [Acidimicrobiales bacterium]